ncbi:hypothetical protein EMIT0P2_20510 [Pseudomonas sp. IT-P2]
MANSGGVSGVFARGHPRLTALCELAVNMARVASQNSALRRDSGLMSPALVTAANSTVT